MFELNVNDNRILNDFAAYLQKVNFFAYLTMKTCYLEFGSEPKTIKNCCTPTY